ncbi:MAG: choice-of-anchor L domain-containing protein [Bacteroidales bacterium]
MRILLRLSLISLAWISLNDAVSQNVPARVPYKKINNRTAEASILSGFTVTPVTPAQLVSYLLGPGAVISNLTYTGSPLALGLFVDSTSSAGLDTGIVISTGDVTNIPGPNISASTSTDFGLPGDSMLTALTVFPTYDAAVIEFDVLVNTDTLSANFVFGSEEYPEFINVSFNDVFAFFISGPGINGTINIAHLPGSNTIISINNVNDQINPQYYVDNSTGTVIEFDGYTVPITLYEPIQNGQTYHFKIAIADCSDRVFDSGILLKKGSVLGYACMPVPGFDPVISGLTVQFTNTTNYAQFYTWDYGDGTMDTTSLNTTTHTYDQPGQYQVTLRAHNYYQVASITQMLSLGFVGLPSAITVPEMKLQNLQGGLYKMNFGAATTADLRVYAITGELKQSVIINGSTSAVIDLSDLAKGLYILQVNTPGKSKTFKLIR